MYHSSFENKQFPFTVNNRSQFLQDVLSVCIQCSIITNIKDNILTCGCKNVLIVLLVLFSDFHINMMQEVLKKSLLNFVLSPFNITVINLKWILWPIVFSRNWFWNYQRLFCILKCFSNRLYFSFLFFSSFLF